MRRPASGNLVVVQASRLHVQPRRLHHNGTIAYKCHSAQMKKPAAKPKKPVSRPDPSPYPKGWNRERVQALIDHYEKQSDDDAIAEANAAHDRDGRIR